MRVALAAWVAIVRYLTHPQVRIDPSALVPDWCLNDMGRPRVNALAGRIGGSALAGTCRLLCIAERKAIESATPLAAALGIEVDIRPAMHENERSATGFPPPAVFEAVADAFFARPSQRIHGWERAIDAQARIVRELEAALADHADGDVLVVGHGAVGTLLRCHYAGFVVGRVHDQPSGGGNFVGISWPSRNVLSGWQAMEAA